MTGREEFVRWARDHAVPLDDLSPLEGMVGDARIVGVGETWHPVHEFLEAQHGIARFLIERMDFTTVLLEASLTTSRQLDTYVNGGPRTDIPLSSVWDNEETMRFLDWLRDHNAKASRKVRIFGLDLHILIMEDTHQPGASSVTAVIERLDGDLPHLDTVRRVLEDFATVEGDPRVANFSYFHSLSPETRQRLKEAFTDAARRLKLLDDEWALHRATTVLQALRMYESDTARGLGIRAAAMAEKARWAIDQHPGKAVLLGASVHTARAPWTYAGSDMVLPSVGMRLARWLGSGYVALATTFNRGSFDPPHPITGTADLPAGDPECLDLALAEIGTAPVLLDLRPAPAGWIDEPRPLRPMQNVAAPPAYLMKQAFDLVIHVDEIRGAQPRQGIVSHPL